MKSNNDLKNYDFKGTFKEAVNVGYEADRIEVYPFTDTVFEMDFQDEDNPITNNRRIGKEIEIRGFHVRGIIRWNPYPDFFHYYDDLRVMPFTDVLRIMIVTDCQPPRKTNDEDINWKDIVTELLEDQTDILSFRDLSNSDRFTVLYDKFFTWAAKGGRTTSYLLQPFEYDEENPQNVFEVKIVNNIDPEIKLDAHDEILQGTIDGEVDDNNVDGNINITATTLVKHRDQSNNLVNLGNFRMDPRENGNAYISSTGTASFPVVPPYTSIRGKFMKTTTEGISGTHTEQSWNEEIGEPPIPHIEYGMHGTINLQANTVAKFNGTINAELPTTASIPPLHVELEAPEYTGNIHLTGLEPKIEISVPKEVELVKEGNSIYESEIEMFDYHWTGKHTLGFATNNLPITKEALANYKRGTTIYIIFMTKNGNVEVEFSGRTRFYDQ